MGASFLEIIDTVDGFPYDKGSNGFYSLIAHDGKTPLGYVSKTVAPYFGNETGVHLDHTTLTITIDSDLDTLEKRSEAFKQIALNWKQLEFFKKDLADGWRDELYTVYNPTHCPYMLLERAFSVLIGVITYGVHINGYIPSNKSSNGKMKLWIPRRSSTKPTYPGMLDNTVAGGLGYPHGLFETVIKECHEEAGLDKDYITNNVKNAGALLYLYWQKNQLIERVQPEVEFIYDLCFNDETSIVPHPVDGEAEDFQLLDVDQVVEKLKNLEFKPNCRMVVIDFLIRHGYLDPEIEHNFLEIQSRSHRRMPFPTL